MEEKINGKPNNRTDNRNRTNCSNTIQNGGSSFTKREFILDATTYDPYTGERSEYENVIPLEFSGDKCAELDRFNQGDVVTVSFVLQRTFLDESRRRTQTYGIYSVLQNRCAWRCISIPTNNIGTTASATTDLSATAAELFRLRLMLMAM